MNTTTDNGNKPAEPLAGGLLALQARMTAYLLQPDARALTAVTDMQAPAPVTRSDEVGDRGADASLAGALRRLGVYHGAYRARLLETLRDTYGHTLRLLGDEAFDALALAYVERAPSTHRNLRWYGATWPNFLAESPVEVDSGDAGAVATPRLDLAELASLDWALREAFDGPDDTVLGLRDLQQLAPEAWGVVCLRPHATVRCLTLRHNTLQRWHALDEERPVPDAELLPQPDSLLVWRRDDRPHFRSMDPPEAWAVRQLLAGRPWAALCEGLAQTWPDQDATTLAAQCLRRWVDEGVLAAAVVDLVLSA